MESRVSSLWDVVSKCVGSHVYSVESLATDSVASCGRVYGIFCHLLSSSVIFCHLLSSSVIVCQVFWDQASSL